MPIHLYAEHLLNIRTLSIQANLSTVSNTETKARLSADGKILTLSHEGESACITLPINLSPKRQSNITLTIPAVPWRELNFRLSLEEREDVAKGTGVLSRDAPVESGNVVPWSATSLSAETEICCKVCGAGIVPRGRVREWRDLPSEGWAEMMDFWHCHKPPEPQGTNGHDHGGLAKGYGIASQIALRSGIGMVDVTEFLLAAEDCRNIRVSPLSFLSIAIFWLHLVLVVVDVSRGKQRTGAPVPQGKSLQQKSGYTRPRAKTRQRLIAHLPLARDG